MRRRLLLGLPSGLRGALEAASRIRANVIPLPLPLESEPFSERVPGCVRIVTSLFYAGTSILSATQDTKKA
jgi:hypothetical protein